ncbi:MAG TPA: MarR family winged helix-turn-helix transcriptional regulator [Dissulfurispiraceae bacterium]|nr:MarR family winged helix-turn-helix transcriptional regulator [Dissulfurispiraceae bacterium]
MDEKQTLKLIETVGRECLAGRIRKISRVITGIYDRAMRPHGIKVNQAGILVMLSLTKKPKPGDICRMFQMEKSTVSRNIERMRKQGWIEVGKEDGGLSQVLTVTPKGKKLLTDVYGKWEKAQKEVSEFLGEDGVKAVHMLTDRMSEPMGRQK